MEFDIENTFLLKACNLSSENTLEALLLDLPNDFDWTLLVQLALTHGVSGLLCHSLLKVPAELVPDEILHASREHLRQQHSVNQKHFGQLEQILRELEKVGVDAVPIKGPTLAISAFGNLGIRSFHDLDFLIRHSDVERCLKRLNELGYIHERQLTPRQWQEYLHYKEEDILFGPGLPLEPHWAFTPRTLAIDIDFDPIWRRVHRAEYNGQSLLSMSPEDELILLCIHGCKELWHKLKWVADLAAFVQSHPDLNWQAIYHRAETVGISRMVNLGLLLAHYLLEMPLAEPVVAQVRSDKFVRQWSEKIVRDFFVEKPPNNIWIPGYFHWSMRENLSDRFRYFFRTLFQPQEDFFSIVKLPDKWFFLYRPLRFFYYLFNMPYSRIRNKITANRDTKI